MKEVISLIGAFFSHFHFGLGQNAFSQDLVHKLLMPTERVVDTKRYTRLVMDRMKVSSMQVKQHIWLNCSLKTQYSGCRSNNSPLGTQTNILSRCCKTQLSQTQRKMAYSKATAYGNSESLAVMGAIPSSTVIIFWLSPRGMQHKIQPPQNGRNNNLQLR